MTLEVQLEAFVSLNPFGDPWPHALVASILLLPRTGCGCQEVKESVGSGWGVASGRDFLKPDRFTTVSWAQDRTAVSYKCPCQSPGQGALLPEEAPGSRAPTPPWLP